MPSELMRQQIPTVLPTASAPDLSSLITQLDAQLAVYDDLKAQITTKQDEINATEQRIQNGEAALAERRAARQPVPPAWATALAALRVDRERVAGDCADLSRQVEASYREFCTLLNRYESAVDAAK